jgi:Zn-dependent protease
MDRMAAEARALEAQSRLMDARTVWLSILPLLPPESNQAGWIREHARELERAAPTAQKPGSGNVWAKRLGPLAPLALLAGKAKGLWLIILKYKFFWTLLSFFGFYGAIWGLRFGIGFAVLVLIHEMGHYIDIKRRGLPAEAPVFIPGLMAYVRWDAMKVSLETRAAVSLAGPLAGLLASIGCFILWRETGNAMWAGLTRAGAWLNILNLTPIALFDGGQAARALRKLERPLLLAVSVGLAYVTRERVFYIVTAGAVWLVISGLMQARQAAAVVSVTNQGVSIVAHPEAPLARPESHFIAAYYLAVLTGLAVMMWLVPLPQGGAGLR